MRKRFRSHDPAADPIPWELDDKYAAYEYVAAAGYAVPRYAKAAGPAEALEIGMTFGGRFVVKQPNRHSSKGIFVLESIGGGRYLDLLRMNVVTAADIVTDGPAPEYWLAEECIDSGIEGKPVPFDYKVYAFRGQVTHVNQIDRNSSPARAAFFDGAFIPLEVGRDITLDESRWLPGHHVIPRHAGAMIEMASTLSKQLDTRFVKVDCYDGPDGPVFGEFTFASGGDDGAMMQYNPEILAKLDQATAGEEAGALSGFDLDMERFRSSLKRRPTVTADAAVYSRLACSAAQGDHRYAHFLTSNMEDGIVRPVFNLAANLIGYLNGDGSRAFSIQRLIHDQSPLLRGLARYDEFKAKARDFHGSRAEGNPWHTIRAAEIGLVDDDPAALDALRELADAGHEHARAVLTNHEQRVRLPDAAAL